MESRSYHLLLDILHLPDQSVLGAGNAENQITQRQTSVSVLLHGDNVVHCSICKNQMRSGRQLATTL